MDLAFWGFRHWPFDRSTCGHQPFVGARHEEAFARLMFLIEERRHCGLLCGAAGTGKSCLFRQVHQKAFRLGRQCVRLDATGLDGTELAFRVASDCQADVDENDSSARIWSRLHTHLSSLSLVKQPLVVLIDHFDLVDFSCSQSLRRMIDLAEATDADLTLLLACRERFTAPLLLDAVELHVELSAWSEDETAQFMWDAMRKAGSTEAIFTADAIQTIHSITRGNPAKVVWLCDLAMLAALSENRRRIDSSVVQSAAMELSPHNSPLQHYRMSAMSLA